MNKKIKELAALAGAKTGHWDGSTYPLQLTVDGDIEKFAKLIIEECAKVADENALAVIDSQIGNIIKEHFGIKNENLPS